ncbi:MAG: hypothetical protein QW734_06385 [Candidatus Bathyarchaeia archaeon]
MEKKRRMSERVRLTVRLEKGVYRLLKMRALQLGSTLNTLVNRAINNYLDEFVTPPPYWRGRKRRRVS